MNTQKRIYFNNLDLFRFIAAYMIIIFHGFYGWVANYGYPSFMLNEANKLSRSGTYIENILHNLVIGVDVFFLISGFLITYLLLYEKNIEGKINIGKFYIRRILRIWPLYFFIIMMGPILTYFFKEPVPEYRYFLSFTGNFEIINNGFSSAATNHLWSICIEEHFYLLWPLIIAFIPNKKIPFVLITVILASIIFRGLIVKTENYWMNLYMHTFSRIDVLAIGSLGAYYFLNNKLTIKDTYNIRNLIYGIFLYMYINDDVLYWDSFFFATIKKYFYVLIIGYFIVNFLFNKEARFVPKENNILHYFGKLSYSAYMLSPLAILLLIKGFKHYEINNLPLFAFLLHILVLILAIGGYKFIELPFLRLKEKFTIVQTEPIEETEIKLINN